MKQNNTISIPGYKGEVQYGDSCEMPYVSQYNFLVDSKIKEINFFNESARQVNWGSASLIAVWRVKSIR